MQKEENTVNIPEIVVSRCIRGFTNSAAMLKVKLFLDALL